MIFREIWINTIKDLEGFHGGNLGEGGSHWYHGIQLDLSTVICEFHFCPFLLLSSLPVFKARFELMIVYKSS
jgi:hypothetical protein